MYDIQEIYQEYLKATPVKDDQLQYVLREEIELQAMLLSSLVNVTFVPWEPYEDYHALKKCIEKNSGMLISELNDVKTPHQLSCIAYNTCREVSFNLWFRAIHDYFGHYVGDFDFTWEGECGAFDLHSRMFSPSVRGILKAEILGQAAYRIVTGTYINPQPFMEMP